MSWASMFKAGVKGVATFIEVVDGVADAATLGDEIAKAALGKGYDPAFRDKAQAVAETGKKVDALVAKVKAKQKDVDNFDAVLRTLNLSLDLHDFKQFQATSLIDKVGKFNLSFGAIPTAYTWLIGPAARTDSNIESEELLKNIADVQEYLERLKFNPVNTALLSSALTIKALVVAYKYRVWRKEKAGLDDIEMRPVGRQRRNAFSGMEMLPDADQKAIKKLRRMKLSQAVDVFSKAGSAVSLGFTIKNIFDRVDSRNSAFAALETQLTKYKEAVAAYEYCISGYKSVPAKDLAKAIGAVESARQKAANADNSAEAPTLIEQALQIAESNLAKELNKNSAFKSAKAYFQVDDPNNLGKKIPWSEKDDLGLAFGMESVIAQYSDQGDSILANIKHLFEDMIDSLEGAKKSSDPTDEAVKQYVIGAEVLQGLKQDKAAFERLAAIASNKLHSTQERKENGFDPIQNRFQVSLQTLMSKVINDASEKLRDVQFASQLLVSARRILREADQEKLAVESRANGAEAQNVGIRNLVIKLLTKNGNPPTEAAITEYMQANGLGSAVEQFDRNTFIKGKIQDYGLGEWVASDLDTDPTVRFPDSESAIACLTLMLEDLQNAPSVHITNEYVWLPEEYTLPLVFRCSVVCKTAKDEFIPCFSKTQTPWNGRNRDALSWYLSSARHDFTFRTNLFGGFPKVVRPTPGFNAELGKKYRMKCEIRRDTATYWIDGKKYATATYGAEDVPASGYIGFAVFGTADISVEDISIASL